MLVVCILFGMRKHHTKNKGDYGVLKAKLDLFIKGYLICNPETEHAPFDFIAYKNKKFLRVQVKYRTVSRGSVSFASRTNWADRNGSHSKAYDKNELDIICLYCPNTDKCYYLDIHDVKCTKSLRIQPAKNNQKLGVLMAADFTEIPKRLL